MSDTPRTDRLHTELLERDASNQSDFLDMLFFARVLERELSAAVTERDQLRRTVEILTNANAGLAKQIEELKGETP